MYWREINIFKQICWVWIFFKLFFKKNNLHFCWHCQRYHCLKNSQKYQVITFGSYDPPQLAANTRNSLSTAENTTCRLHHMYIQMSDGISESFTLTMNNDLYIGALVSLRVCGHTDVVSRIRQTYILEDQLTALAPPLRPTRHCHEGPVDDWVRVSLRQTWEGERRASHYHHRVWSNCNNRSIWRRRAGGGVRKQFVIFSQ